jgi:hypothetical protein
MDDDNFWDRMIDSQRRAIRYYTIFAGVIFSLGLVVIGIAYIIVGSILPDVFKNLIGLGGGFVSSLSSLPIKEILSRKERVDVFVLLKSILHENKIAGGKRDDEVKRINDLSWKILEKIAIG